MRSLLLLAVFLTAGPENDDPVLGALLTEAVAYSPDVAAAEAEVEAARQRVAAARALPDPEAAVGYTNDGVAPSLGTREMTTLGVTVSQELVRPGLRRLRGEEAAVALRAREAALVRARLSVEADVRRACASLRRAGEARGLLRAQQELWDDVERSARIRYEVGRAPQADILRAQVERSRAQGEWLAVEAEAEVQQARLESILGRPLEVALLLPAPPAVAVAPLDVAAATARAEDESPELQAATDAEEGARLAAEIARRGGGTDITVQAGYMNRGGLDPMWQAGLSLRLPVRRSRVRAEVAEATADRARAESRRASVRRTLRLRTRERLARLQAAQGQARLFREALLPQGELALESARAGYETGSASLQSVLEAAAVLGRDRLAYLEQLERQATIEASLREGSLGPTPSGAMEGDRP